MKKNISLYSVVQSNKRLDECVPKGVVGVVLIIYQSNDAVYEVEFLDGNGESLAVLTVKGDDLDVVHVY